jgi:cytoplasmic FMR1 interacting protein
MESTNSLDEALKNVNLLDDLALCDEQPVIEAPAASITYNPNFDTNFEDSEAFITCNSKYLEEAAMHRGLVSSNYLI